MWKTGRVWFICQNAIIPPKGCIKSISLTKKMTRQYFEKMKNDRLGNVNERIELLKKVHNDIEGQTYEDLLCASDRQ